MFWKGQFCGGVVAYFTFHKFRQGFTFGVGKMTGPGGSFVCVYMGTCPSDLTSSRFTEGQFFVYIPAV